MDNNHGYLAKRVGLTNLDLDSISVYVEQVLDLPIPNGGKSKSGGL